MHYLVYISAAVYPFSEAELLELLNVSRRNNALLDITGMLLYKDGRFMQLLEGEKDAALALTAKVARDPRHRRLTVLLEGDRPRREFPDWSLGFQRLDTPEARDLPGYRNLFNVPLDDAIFTSNASECLKMFLNFRKQPAAAPPAQDPGDRYRFWNASRPAGA